MIDLTFRCFSLARWITVATSRGIYDASGNVVSGFDVDEIGFQGLADAVYDPVTHAITTPAVIDTWYWINLRLSTDKADADADTLYAGEVEDGFKFTKSKLVKFVRDQATLVNLTFRGTTVRTYQFGAAANRIQLFDPRDYQTVRVREWLGGPQY